MDVLVERPQVIGALLLGLVGYAYYYLRNVKSKPHFIAKKGSIAEFFIDHLPILTENFSPTPWCFTGRFQTFVRPLLKSFPTVEYAREHVPLPDDGEIIIDWFLDGKLNKDASYPIVVILPGLTGCSCANYIKHMVLGLSDLGYRVVVFNNRGTCKQVLKTPKGYCAAYTSDAALVFNHIRRRCPDSPMVAIGISLGGMILYNYLASLTDRASTPLSAALIISVVWDPSVSAKHMENPVDWFLFNRILTNYLVRQVQKNAHVLRTQYNIENALKARTVKQFDSSLTVQMFGYNDVEHYYEHVNLPSKLQDVQIPLLCLAAEDDPFVPKNTLPLTKVATTDNVAMVLTKRGGHIGFLEGWFPRYSSYMDRVAFDFAQSVFDNLERLEHLVVTKGRKP